jgi:hypothetical protein
MKQPTPDDKLLESVFCASSANDCTGLIPVAPKSDEELEHYSQLYTYLPSPPVPSNDRIKP